jgi:hypothetical protein
MRRIALPLLPAAVALSILLAACRGGLGGAGGSTGPIDHPSGDALILGIDYSGGFVAPGFRLTAFPPFSLTGDGRVIVPGPQIDLFPGPALPAVNVRRLDEAGIQAVLDLVTRTARFDADSEYRGAQNVIADAADTVFTLHADGKVVHVVVYALDTRDPAGNYPAISADELAAHRALSELLERLGAIDSWMPAYDWAETTWHGYQPDALRLVVRNADSDAPDESGIGNVLLAWPVASDPAVFSEPGFDDLRCGVVSGQEAEDWYAALSTANQLTRFVKDDHRYEVTVRFQLPDEPMECPSPAV